MFERKEYQGFNLFGRLKALGVHLVFSVIIFLVFLFVMLSYWYPMPHFLMNGGWQGIRIMLMVDIVIGPLLTFFLYNNRKSKKELRFDLGLIVIIQAGLLVYGIHAVYKQRPVVQALTYNGYIATVLENDLRYKRKDKPIKYIKSLAAKGIYPPLVYAINPDWKNIPSNNQFDRLFKKDDNTGYTLSPEKYLDNYTSLNDPYFLSESNYLVENARKKLDLYPEIKKQIKAYEAKHGVDKYYFFRLKGEYGEATVVYSKDFKPVDYFGFKLYD